MWYAARSDHKSGETVFMHQVIMGGKGIDHIGGDGLNNQRSNLRFASQKEQNMNKRKASGNFSSKHKGVSYDYGSRKWRVRVGKHYVGRFETEEEARLAYNEAASEIYGEFARLNNA